MMNEKSNEEPKVLYYAIMHRERSDTPDIIFAVFAEKAKTLEGAPVGDSHIYYGSGFTKLTEMRPRSPGSPFLIKTATGRYRAAKHLKDAQFETLPQAQAAIKRLDAVPRESHFYDRPALDAAQAEVDKANNALANAREAYNSALNARSQLITDGVRKRAAAIKLALDGGPDVP